MYNVLFLVCVLALSYYIKLSNDFILRLIVSSYIFFLSIAIVSNLLTILLLILIKTITSINVVELYSVRVVLISSSREYYTSRYFPKP